MSLALITGATGGIGRAISGALARDGLDLFLTARSENNLSDLRAKLAHQFPERTISVRSGDLSDSSFIEDLFKLYLTNTDLSVLVNNAGISIGTDIFSLSVADWEATIAVNLTAPFLLTRAALPILAARGGGSIINIASLAAVQGASKPNYAASKAGLIGLTKSTAQSVGGVGIRANAIIPGAVDTDMIADWNVENRAVVIDRTSLRRIASPNEIADVVSFLASDKSRFITGTAINVTGGQYLGN